MTLCFTGNTFKYEMENIVRLFFPLQKFQYAYEPDTLPEGDLVWIQRQTEADTQLTVTVRRNGETHTRSSTLPGIQEGGPCEMELGRLLYDLLFELTGIRPQWGILTGVRPVKWVQQRLAAGRTQEEIRRELSETLYLSEGKLDLALQIARAQQEILADDQPRDYSLYLSIPYCPSRCSYCSFVSHAITQKKALELVPKYLRMLVKELYFTAEIARNHGLRLRSVYIGGGTPTTLTAKQLKQLTDAIKLYFPLDDGVEYTIEAGRPDTIDLEKLQVIRDAGARRISINPQTFSDSVLQAIGRKHAAEDVVNRYLEARQVGFDSINMDFIAGLPTDTYESFCSSIDRAVSLRPENITVHTLSIKRSSNLFAEGHEPEDYRPTQQMVDYAYRTLTAAGYIPYYLYRQKNTIGNLENVGYALPGHFGRYNVYIMEEVQTILAAGAGAVSKVVLPGEIHRVYNYKYPYEYISQFDDILARKESLHPFLERLP